MIKINLLPPERRKKVKKAAPTKKKAFTAGLPSFKLQLKFDSLVVFPAAAGALALLLMGGSFFWLGYKEKSIKSQRDSLRVELNQLNLVIKRIDSLKERTTQVRQRMDVIMEVDKNRFLWPRLLDDISTSLPRYTWLETMSEISPLPELVLRIEGNTMSNILLSELLFNLQQKESLKNVQLVSSAERTHGSYQTKYFVIQAASAFNRAPADSTAGQVGTAK